MAALGSQSIASSYEQLLHVDADGGGNSTTHVSVKDGDNGTTFGFTIASDALMMSSTNRLEFGDTGTYIHQSADGVLDLVSDTEIELNATTLDINAAVDISGATTTAGDIKIDADDKGLVLGADQDATIFSDAAGVINFVRGTDVTPATDDAEGWFKFLSGSGGGTQMWIYGADGEGCELNMFADQGDDNDDKYRLHLGTTGDFSIDSYSTGSWVTQLKLDGSATDVTVSAGDLLFATAGKGICLGVTSNTDSNTLDDYEEGTWTCAAATDSGSITVNTSYNLGYFTKIGNLCTVQGYFTVSAISSPSGDMHLTGLPFTSAAASEGAASSSGPIYIRNLASAVVGTIAGYVGSGSTSFYMRAGGQDDNGEDIAAQVDTGTSWYMTVTYRTA